MTETTAVATADERLAKVLAGMVRKEDMGDDAAQIPILKINYDVESVHERGKWVVGQTKDADGNITEEGQLVKGLVVLMVKRRYSYYVQTDTAKNCNSIIFSGGEAVFGSKYGHNCKSGDCPYRDKDLNPRCKAQWLVFGMALTEENKLVDCMAYVQGASYMPFDEHRRTITRLKGHAGYISVPPFAFMTLLGSEKRKNGGTTYFVAEFTRGQMFKEAQCEMFAAKREEVDAAIVGMNSRVSKAKDAPVAEAVTTAPASLAEAIDADFKEAPATEVVETSEIDISAFTAEVPDKAAPAPEPEKAIALGD